MTTVITEESVTSIASYRKELTPGHLWILVLVGDCDGGITSSTYMPLTDPSFDYARQFITYATSNEDAIGKPFSVSKEVVAMIATEMLYHIKNFQQERKEKGLS